MRVDRNQVIAGMAAPAARSVVRYFPSPRLADVLPDSVLAGRQPLEILASLEREGFVMRDREDASGEIWWKTTISGNALAMASFGKLISRRTADRLLTELIERTRGFNADPHRIMYVERLRIFGSYLRSEIDQLGDLDVEIRIGRRDASPQGAKAYTRASGRNFGTYLAELSWPRTELLQILKNRSPAINITEEDVSELSGAVEIVYSILEDPAAIPPPSPAPEAVAGDDRGV